MTPKERWLAVLQREVPDRIPMDYWGTPEATQKVMAYLGVDDFWEMCKLLNIDMPVTVRPAYIGPQSKPGTDYYGRRLKRVEYDGGAYDEVVDYPLARFKTIEEIEENYT